MSAATRRRFGSIAYGKLSWLARLGIAGSIVTASHTSAAATWPNGTTPRLSEIVAIDGTGEPGWPYGAEDLLGDGATFTQAEQQMDIRTAYAATDTARFYARVYFSDPATVGSGVTTYIFIDADRNSATGGPASATDINPALTIDPSPGGYEFVIGVAATGAVVGVWEYGTNMWAMVTTASSMGEAGSDADPIKIGSLQHGYVQGVVNMSAVGLTPECSAILFVRSVSGTGGDLDGGQWGSCVPADTNGDRVPDVIIPAGGCTSDAQCPGGGTCKNGICSVPPGCSTDADCASTEQCTSGQCVARPGGSCTTTAQCGDLVCNGTQCVACRSDSECGTGRTCSSTGRCVGNIVLAPGENVEGGAFNCALSPLGPPGSASGRAGTRFLAATLAAALTLFIRKRRTRFV